jgi:hypothetical protein
MGRSMPTPESDRPEAEGRVFEADGQVVDLRFFGGPSVREVTATLEVSNTTVEGYWRFSRAWLSGQLGGPEP